MKSIITLALGLILTSTSFASLVDGEYNCGNQSGKLQISYKIKTVTTDGVTFPLVDISKIYAAEGNKPAQTFKIKGIATQLVDDQGNESLMIGNMNINLTNGRPTCSL